MTNTTENIINGNYDANDQRIVEISQLIRNISLPLIAIIGFLGNTVSLIVFTVSGLKSRSSSKFLSSLALTDNVILISILLSWIDGSFYNIFLTKAGCMLFNYLTYISSFLSVWFIVGFTTERFFAIGYPLHSQLICSNTKGKIALSTLVFIAFAAYSFTFFTTEIVPYKSRLICDFKADYRSLMKGITWVDTALTLVIPVMIIIIMNTRVLWLVFKFHRNRKQLRVSNFVSTRKQNGSHGTRPSSQLRVTRTLLLVSTTFVVLNLPSHIFKLYITILQKTDGDTSPSYTMYLIQEITQVFFYASFSCNFFLYTLSGKQFKNALCGLIRSMDLKKRPGKCFGHIRKDLHMKQEFLCNTLELKEIYLKNPNIERVETDSVLTTSKAAHQKT
ncbi:hypothetical protein ACJMK2_015901 [Sinanodonta woodiana]|uniref:G-protein coupled receptors family 1 profile domain-containing protein n=1 Tax=Sinanodonta woodiana TaxID=1069815 RepID=A0ABD3URW7_SINWO